MKGFKTVIFNSLGSIMPILEVSGITGVLEGDALKWYIIGMAVANIVLRFMTTTAVGKSE
ncbi:MAG: hypothetical protein COB36_12360 [Alphaproteobacteria bacterium]|nr:MAG: hypothetical protein COB36_12360 [Alphaproteobacteria bacterium]